MNKEIAKQKVGKLWLAMARLPCLAMLKPYDPPQKDRSCGIVSSQVPNTMSKHMDLAAGACDVGRTKGCCDSMPTNDIHQPNDDLIY